MVSGREPPFVSPDGSRFAAIVFRGDPDDDRIVAEIVSGDLGPDRAPPRVVARLTSRGLGEGKGYYTRGPASRLFWRQDDSFPFRWLDANTRIGLIWENDLGIWQAVSIDVRAGHVTFLTSHATNIRTFDRAENGAIFYTAELDTSAAVDEASRLQAHGYVVDDLSATRMILGAASPDLIPYARRTQAFLKTRDGPPRLLRGEFNGSRLANFSPDGMRLMIDVSPDETPAAWLEFDNPETRRAIALRSTNKSRDRIDAAVFARVLMVFDVANGSPRTLWTAPVGQRAVVACWSPDGKSVLVVPTLLPGTANKGSYGAVVINVSTGKHDVIVAAGVAGELSANQASWVGSNRVALERFGVRHVFDRSNVGWEPTTGDAATSHAAVRVDPPRVTRAETPNQRPKLMISQRGGPPKLLFDPDPDLERTFAIGAVRRIQGISASGIRWSGRVYYPPHFTEGRRYPVVVQSYSGSTGNGYSLYGPQDGVLGTGRSIYAAQMLAGRDIVVLQLERLRERYPAGVEGTAREPAVECSLIEAAVQTLDRMNLIDPTRVGLLGFSRSGWIVEYALSNTDANYAAAIVSDNIDGGYFQYIYAGGGERYYPSPPTGAGLEDWLEEAPSFNAYRIRTPIRFIAEQHPAAPLFHWETVVQLKELGLPAELYVAPNLAGGMHGLRNPGQVLALKQGTVEWFDFWLNGVESADPAKSDQYRRWRILRTQRDAIAGTPRPRKLDWSAKPR